MLERQLRRLSLTPDAAPTLDQWQAFLGRVKRAYDDAEQDRYTLERSLMMSSSEMQELYDGLRLSEANLRTILERSPDLVFVLRADGTLVYTNTTLVRALGYQHGAELVGQKAVDTFVHDDDRGVELTGGPAQLRLVALDGREFTVETNTAQLQFDGEEATLVLARDITEKLAAETEHRRVEAMLRRSDERYRLLFESSRLPILFFDAYSLEIIDANSAASELYGCSREEFTRLTMRDLEADQPTASLPVPSSTGAPSLSESRWSGERSHRRRDGSKLDVEVATHPITLHERRAVVAMVSDISERRRLEEQLRQSQKMEAIGQLAGGVAHDFNNLLTVILSYATLIMEDLGPNDPMRSDVEEIHRAGELAGELTRQLLAFSRKQLLKPKVFDLSGTVAGMEKMLRRLLGEGVPLSIRSATMLGRVHADPSQIEQVILNLVVNARDAVGRHGQVTIETANEVVREDEGGAHAAIPEGRYVVLRVSDNGVGMDGETRARIFDPFFTKECGKGSGLGLSTVFGIVRQSGGYLNVTSEPGRGSTFEVYLPQTGLAVEVEPPPPRAIPEPMSATILLVEDEDGVRGIVREILRREGYIVLEAQNAGEAFLICERHGAPIDLLLTDVVMPRLNGGDLAARLAPMRPEMKILFMSGFTQGELDSFVAREYAYLQKPFSPLALKRKVRELLFEQSVACA
jgi:PAS domain S-box-containing protein